ncbi:hypothetical protein K440DRAFT_628104 [Wilcoxina mikolae CBS 423.85]|nr:hypothetical protein K440DRAFT_628104 [Wilcoxina mikolae CBS 423.85]
MSAHQKPNPTKGTKVSSTSPSDIKPENPGPIANDSLAADSLRSGGSFASGPNAPGISGGSFASGPNAPGISGATGASGTFCADPEGGSKVSRYDGKKPEEALGEPDDRVKSKAGQVRSQGGHERVEDAGGRGSSHTAGSQSYAAAAARGGETQLNTAINPKAFSGMGVPSEGKDGVPSEGKVGESAEDVDWSKISKDTNTTTDIGGEDDPGRLAEQKMLKKSVTRGGGENIAGEGNSFAQLDEEEI